MNLELLEEIAADYLSQTANPLVPIDTLHKHLCGNEDLAQLTLLDLTDFIGPHALFKIIDTPGLGEEATIGLNLAEALGTIGPCVILHTRVPTQQDMTRLMLEQLQGMTDALRRALSEAKASDNRDLEARLSDVLANADRIREQLGALPH